MNPINGNAAVVTAATPVSPDTTGISATTPQIELRAEPTLEAVPRSPILITEKEVRLSTAAVVPVHPATLSWWTKAARGAFAAIHRILLTSTADGARVHRDYPSRLAYLEHSLMAREMDRL